MSFIAGTRITSGSGGTISSITGYTVHTFSTPGAATFVPRGNGAIEVLVVGAGGASQYGYGGGGGGAVFYNKFVNVTSGTSYPITVGAVGSPTGGISSCTFNNATIIAYGGGSGAPGFVPGYGSPSLNASGGGTTGNNGTNGIGVGAGITGLGFPGGGSYGSNTGGGGGAGGSGYNSGAFAGGNGGIGVSYSITGISSYYGAGGGGAGTGPGFPNGGIPGASYGTGETITPSSLNTGAVIIRYPS
jgi:hypothetical protein